MRNRILHLLKSSLFLVLLISTFSVQRSYAYEMEFPSPMPERYINDYAGIMERSDKDKIISIGMELEEKTGSQAVIVTINSTNDMPIEDYANKLFRTWGLGEKDKNNGLLILLALNDKAYRIEVGKGLEGVIPDALASRVMTESARPYFINSNYSTGLLNSYSIFCDKIAEEYDVTLKDSLNLTVTEKKDAPANPLYVKFIRIALVILLLCDLFFNRGRVLSAILQILFWSSFSNRHRGGHNSGGGFGGGSSNGGGASGGW